MNHQRSGPYMWGSRRSTTPTCRVGVSPKDGSRSGRRPREHRGPQVRRRFGDTRPAGSKPARETVHVVVVQDSTQPDRPGAEDAGDPRWGHHHHVGVLARPETVRHHLHSGNLGQGRSQPVELSRMVGIRMLLGCAATTAAAHRHGGDGAHQQVAISLCPGVGLRRW